MASSKYVVLNPEQLDVLTRALMVLGEVENMDEDVYDVLNEVDWMIDPYAEMYGRTLPEIRVYGARLGYEPEEKEDPDGRR